MGSIGIISAGLVISFFGLILYLGTIVFNFFFSSVGNNNVYREFYECGFNASVDNVETINLHFILITLIFLIYEMEVILFVPLFLNLFSTTVAALSIIWFCLIIIALSYVYEWERYALTFTF